MRSPMHRYYFHDGSPDATGVDLPDDTSARAMACDALAERIKDTCFTSPGTAFSLRVTDENGRSVAALTFLGTV